MAAGNFSSSQTNSLGVQLHSSAVCSRDGNTCIEIEHLPTSEDHIVTTYEKKTWKRFKWLADHRFWSLFSSQMIQTCLGWTRLTIFFKKSTHFWHQFLFQMLSNLTCSSIWKAQLTHKALGLYLEETGGGGWYLPQKKTPANHKQIDEVKNATSRFHLWQVDLE